MSIKKHLKTGVLFIFICVLLLNATQAFSASGKYIKVYVNGNETVFDNLLFVSQQEVMVPVREFVELLNGTVTWYEEDEIAICSVGQYKAVVQNNKSNGKIGSTLVNVQPVPSIIAGVLYAPLSFLCSGFNLDYLYNNSTNEININQKPETFMYYVDNEVYVSQTVDGIRKAQLNLQATYYYVNTLSSGSKGELYYEINLGDYPKNFSKAMLVIPAAKINVKGTYIISEVTGWNGKEFGNIDFTDSDSITLTDNYEAPKDGEIKAKGASDLEAKIDITEIVKKFQESNETVLRLHIDYNTWEIKETWDGTRIKKKGESQAFPHIEMTSDPEYITVEDCSNISVDYREIPLESSSRIRYLNGTQVSKIDDSSNSGHELNTIKNDGTYNSVINYKFNLPENNKTKNALLTIHSRATSDGVLVLKNIKTGKSISLSVLFSETYSDISFNIGELVDTMSDSIEIQMEYTPNNNPNGVMYVFSIDSEHEPYLGLLFKEIINPEEK